MKNKFLLIALLISASISNIHAQVRFQKIFGGTGNDIARCVMQTSDKGYLLCGSTTSFGNGMRDVYIIKTDSMGNEQWAKTFGGANDDEATWALEDNGSYYIGGNTASYGAGGREGFFARLDLTGSILWFKTFGTSGIDYDWLKFHKTIDNGFILVFGYRQIIFSFTIIKTDINGNVQWTHTYGGTQTNVAGDVVQLADSGFLFSGYTYAYGMGAHDCLITRTDSLGNILWSKTVGSYRNEGIGYTILKLNNNEAFTISLVDNSLFGARDAVFIKFNYQTGNIIWAKEYGKAGQAYSPLSCVQTPDKGFASDICDWLYTSGHDMGILRTDSAGNLLWVQKYGGAGDDVSYCIINTNDNGFAVAGYTSSFGAGGKDLYFVKTDSIGQSGCNEHADFLQQGQNPYQVTSPAIPEIFPNKFHNSYSVSSSLRNDSLRSLCISSSSLPQSNFIPSDTTFCGEGQRCIDFFDRSSGNPTSWQWIFPGAVPASSTQQNPTHICYNQNGNYDVTLIVTNAAGTDTITISPMVKFSAGPLPPVISLQGDTLVCSTAFHYQWFINAAPIAGASDSFYVAHLPGTYAVQIIDSLGCISVSNGIVITSVKELTDGKQIAIYPNPLTSSSTLQLNTQVKNAEVVIYDMLGKEMMRKKLTGDRMEIERGSLVSGVYFVRVRSEDREWVAKIVVE